MWRPNDPQGNEAGKIRYELVKWTRGRGIDLGCGPWKAYPHFIGFDQMHFPGEPGGPNLTGDCLDLSVFADESMDFVFSSHLLEHVPDTVAALKHWWSKIHAGGYLVLYLPHKDHYPNMGQPGANPDHKHDFIPEDIIRAMRLAALDWDLLENQTRAAETDREYSFFQVFHKREKGFGHKETWKEPRPEKKAAIVRYGAHGDALWASSIFPHLKKDGYHITVYTEEVGATVLMNDPNVDEFIITGHDQIPNQELLAYWLWERDKYDKWINLVGSVETRLLPQPGDSPFYWSNDLRAELMDNNYLETVHQFAGVPMEFKQKFYPTEKEKAWAEEMRSKLKGPVVVLNPSGSSMPKFWPHTQRFIELLAEREIYTVVLGDVDGKRRRINPEIKGVEPYGQIIGKEWPIRLAMAFAQQADAVVGTESAILNAVAMEDMLKVAILSHSSPENLTKHWVNTLPIEAKGVACYPCHRVHLIWHFCTREKTTGAAACQATATAESIAEIVQEYLKISIEVEAA